MELIKLRNRKEDDILIISGLIRIKLWIGNLWIVYNLVFLKTQVWLSLTVGLLFHIFHCTGCPTKHDSW